MSVVGGLQGRESETRGAGRVISRTATVTAFHQAAMERSQVSIVGGLGLVVIQEGGGWPHRGKEGPIRHSSSTATYVGTIHILPCWRLCDCAFSIHFQLHLSFYVLRDCAFCFHSCESSQCCQPDSSHSPARTTRCVCSVSAGSTANFTVVQSPTCDYADIFYSSTHQPHCSAFSPCPVHSPAHMTRCVCSGSTSSTASR
jgi:hypothetical protein